MLTDPVLVHLWFERRKSAGLRAHRRLTGLRFSVGKRLRKVVARLRALRNGR